MKRRITALILCLALIVSALMLTSCAGLFLEDTIESNPDSLKGQTVNLQGGANYDITIENPPPSNVAAANKALLSAVSIVANFKGVSQGIFGSSASGAASGSGVIYKLDKTTGDAYIITNHHVVFHAAYGISEDIDVYLYGGEAQGFEMSATYVGGSLYYDLAVLKITASARLIESNARAAEFANSDEVAVLDTVIAIGNANGRGISATVGHINVDSEYIDMLGADERTEISLRVMRTDAAVNPGNSGGGLFNTEGKVVGIVNAKSADSSVDNVGYAIPSNVAKSIADNIIYYCDGTNKDCVYRCILGIQIKVVDFYTEYDEESGKIFKRETVSVDSVTENTAAAEVLQVGDIITSISVDGKVSPVTRMHHIIDAMLDARVGSTVVFNLVRGGVETSATITVVSNMIEAYN